jgi:hypothetical protein
VARPFVQMEEGAKSGGAPQLEAQQRARATAHLPAGGPRGASAASSPSNCTPLFRAHIRPCDVARLTDPPYPPVLGEGNDAAVLAGSVAARRGGALSRC